MLALPRSARLAVWTTAWLSGDAALDDVVDRVQGDDEPHQVRGVPGSPGPAGLATALGVLRAHGATALALALPRPGDPLGVAGDAATTAEAVLAGEAAVASGADVALVPRVEAFGPPGDQGHLVTWSWLPARFRTDLPGVAEAERALRERLLEAAGTLSGLDVAGWRPEVGRLLEDVRGAVPAEPLPRAYPPRAQALAAQAARLRAVVDLALGDDGGALTSRAAEARRAALLPLEAAARRALVAACGAAEPRR
ncbi:MAG TPA: hypothetical protein VK894_03135 [Jiangellales bacterium]|nr:hypothetical protein [Jiangellales bacterium]